MATRGTSAAAPHHRMYQTTSITPHTTCTCCSCSTSSPRRSQSAVALSTSCRSFSTHCTEKPMARWLRCSAVVHSVSAYRECVRHHEAVGRRRREALERIGGCGLGTRGTQREVCERAGLLIARGAGRRKLVLQHKRAAFRARYRASDSCTVTAECAFISRVPLYTCTSVGARCCLHICG